MSFRRHCETMGIPVWVPLAWIAFLAAVAWRTQSWWVLLLLFTKGGLMLAFILWSYGYSLWEERQERRRAEGKRP